jgi:hypothetical protein
MSGVTVGPVLIGPSFSQDLAAAGLSGLPIAWGSDGVISGRANLTAQQNAALDAVIAAHNPTKPAVPQIVNAAQARLALNDSGNRSLVEAAIKLASQDVQDFWNYSPQISRHHPVLVGIQQQLGWSDAMVDELFIAAGNIVI